MSDAVQRVQSMRVSNGLAAPVQRTIPGEVPVALVYDGATYAVMMATGEDLPDFALGFSLNEGLITSPGEIEKLEVVEYAAGYETMSDPAKTGGTGGGYELRMWLTPDLSRKLATRRRAIAGPTGCGLCGVESLEAAVAPPKPVGAGHVRATAAEIAEAVASLAPAQVLNHATRALHAAGFWMRDSGLKFVREDVGRHNALDKLAGAVRQAGYDPTAGIVVLTSRVSVEMVQKAAAMGAPIVAAVSAPTALALRTAEQAGITLIAVARPDSFEIFTHAYRIQGIDGATQPKPATPETSTCAA